MQAYMNFLLKSTFKKKSVYISSLLTYLIAFLEFYLLPVVLNQPISFVSTQFISYLFLILVLVIQIAVVTVGIFRTGIDDGTEILVVSKSLSRVKIVWTKIIVLLICIVFNSLLCAIIPSFLPLLEYGSSNPTPYCIGFMLLSLIVSLFFGAITILACLGLKKNGAALTSIGIGTGLCVLTMINSTVFRGPGYQTNSKKSFSLDEIMIEQKSNKDDVTSYSNVIFLKRMENFILKKDVDILMKEYNAKSPDELVKKIYDKALKVSNAAGVFYYDPILQWLQLVNLSNFYYDKVNTPLSEWYAPNIFKQWSIANVYLDFYPILQQEKDSWSSIQVSSQNLNPINVIPFINKMVKFKIKEQRSIKVPIVTQNKFLIIPEITINNDGTFSKEVSLKFFEVGEYLKDIQTNPDNKLLKAIDKFVSFEIQYKKRFEQFPSLLKNNLYTFILNYYSAAINIILNNIYNQNNPNQIINLSFYIKKPDPLNDLIPWPIENLRVTYKQFLALIKNMDLLSKIFPSSVDINKIDEILNPKNPNSPLVSSQNYTNPENIEVIYLYITFMWSQLSSIQQIELETLKNQDGSYVDLNIDDVNQLNKLRFFQVPNDINRLFLANIETIEKIMSFTQNPSIENQFLANKLYEQYNIQFDNAPLGFIMNEYLLTATNYKVKHFLNLAGFMVFWISLAFLFLLVSSFIYLKKDFK